jgi:hypothetical protein
MRRLKDLKAFWMALWIAATDSLDQRGSAGIFGVFTGQFETGNAELPIVGALALRGMESASSCRRF